MPVTVWDPPAWIDTLEAGEILVVVGRLRRRFYQRPGGVGPRVDVEAELVGRARIVAGSTPRSGRRSRRWRRWSDIGRGCAHPGTGRALGTLETTTISHMSPHNEVRDA